MESAKNRSSWIHGFGNERQRIVAKYDLPELIEKLHFKRSNTYLKKVKISENEVI